MSRTAWLLLAASLVSSASSCGGGPPAAVDAAHDASVDVRPDVEIASPDADDAGPPPSTDAAVEAGFACALPPAAVDSRVDGGFGCTASPAYTVNGNDVCSSGQYAYGCYGAQAPASLQCNEFSVPNPPDTTFYCCPCVIPTCTQPLNAGCAQPNLAGCPPTLGAARALCEWDAAAEVAYSQVDCGAYVAWGEYDPAGNCTYYYAQSTGGLVAVFCTQGIGPSAVTTCLGGPAGFTQPTSCSTHTKCFAPTDAGDAGSGTDG